MKQNMTVKNTEHFGIQRKIVANMTTESWETIPHVSYIYEADVTDFLKEFSKLKKQSDVHITINTILMKAIIEGIKESPVLNSHLSYNRKLVRGKLETFDQINISMPMVLPNGKMMTVNLRDFQDKTLIEMTDYIAKITHKAENTNLDEAMFEVSLDNTLTGLRQGKFMQAISRLIGSKTGKHKVRTLRGRDKKEYYAVSEDDRLTKHDLEQGTTTITNLGSLYRDQTGTGSLIEIVPPQVTAFAIGAVQDKAAVIKSQKGEKSIEIRQILPITIVFDHRAVDFGDVTPFIKKMDQIFKNPSIIYNWKGENKIRVKKIDSTEQHLKKTSKKHTA